MSFSSSEPMLAEVIPPKILPRILSRFDLTTLYFALIFGSYGAAQMAAQGWAAIPMLTLAAITFLLPCALAALELGTLFPGEGGIYIWAHKTLGPLHGFIAGWLSWVPIFLLLPLGATTIVAHLQIVTGTTFPLWGQILAQLGVVYLVTAISLLRLKLSQGYIKIVFFLALGTAIVALFAALRENGFVTPVDQEIFSLDLGKYGGLYSAAILWLLGVEIPFNMGAEFRPEKKAARSMMLWGSLFLLVGYYAGIVGILGTTTKETINAVTGVALAAQTLHPWIGSLVALAICIAVTSQGVAYMNSYSRLLFISGVEHRLPTALARVTARTRVPVPALLVQALGATVVILIFTTQAQLTVVYNLYLAALVAVWCASLYYLFSGIMRARTTFAALYHERGDLVSRIPGGRVGVGIVALWGTVFTTIGIYYVFALPWTTDISAEIWRLWLGGICLAILASGVTVYLQSRTRVAQIRLEEELTRYAHLLESKR